MKALGKVLLSAQLATLIALCPAPASAQLGNIVEELAGQVRAASAGDMTALTHDGSAVTLPAPTKYVAPIAVNVVALAGNLVDDG